MAIISTRSSSEGADEQFLKDLQGELQSRVDRVLGSGAVQVTADKTELKQILSNLIDGYERATMTMLSDLRDYQLSIGLMQAELQLASMTIEALSNTPFDNALDAAVTEFMDVLTSSGLADITPDNTVVFDPRRTLGKGDLKPALREAITKWIAGRLS